MNIVEAKIIEEDARIVMEWRNDSDTRKMFYNQELKTWDTFWREYSKEYFGKMSLTPCFAQQGERKIAFLRSSKYDIPQLAGVSFDIDINVSPEMRGQGIGSSVIKIFCDRIFSSGVDNVVAEIKKINLPSMKAFQKANFVFFDETIRDTKSGPCEIFRFVKSRDILL
jgi:RimJ/RimL family protein N-acetyltransferase